MLYEAAATTKAKFPCAEMNERFFNARVSACLPACVRVHHLLSFPIFMLFQLSGRAKCWFFQKPFVSFNQSDSVEFGVCTRVLQRRRSHSSPFLVNCFCLAGFTKTMTVGRGGSFTVKSRLWLMKQGPNYPFFVCAFSVLQGELATDHDVVDFIMNQPNVVPRINPRVLAASRSYLDLSGSSE